MAEPSKGRAAIKFGFWAGLAVGFFILAGHLHASGRFSAWYYYQAAEDGYAVNAGSFKDATVEHPAWLEVGAFDSLDGLQAVKVSKGDRLPRHANGLILLKVLDEGKRAAVEGSRIKVMIPWEIQQAKGFKYKDTFKHKGVRTDPWAGLYNVLLVVALGLSLGFMAEGFTDLIGIKVEKIRHFEGH